MENGRQTSANNAQIFSPRQKQTLSKRGPQLSTWRHRQNDGDFGRQRVRSVQNYCSPERSSRAGHRFWVFLIGSQGFASCPTKCFIKSSTVLTPFRSSFLQFRAEVMHCAKFSHHRCFVAKKERKLRIKSFPEKRKRCFPLLRCLESGQLQPFQTFGDFGDEKWSAEAMRFGNLGDSRFFLGNQECRLHIKSSADKRNWLLLSFGKSCFLRFLWGVPSS